MYCPIHPLRGGDTVGKRHRLVSTRKAAGFSQERLAEAVGVERPDLTAWVLATRSIGAFFAAPRLDGLAGTTYLLMSDNHRAIPLLTQARDRRASTDLKGRALVTLDLAECHVVDHEPEEAVRLAARALDDIEGSMVVPILVRARRLRAHLERWPELSAVRELDARLAELPGG